MTLKKSIIPFISGILCINICTAQDLTAPAKGKIYTISVENIGAVVMENVHPTVVVANDSDGLVSIVDVTPVSATIGAGGTQDFQIKFDVACPAPDMNKIVTPKFKFSLHPPFAKAYYAPELDPKIYFEGPDPVWDADFSIKVGPIFTAVCNPPEITIKDGESATHTVTITNTHPENDEEFAVSISGAGPGWSVWPPYGNLKVAPGESQEFSFTVANSKATSDLDLSVSVMEGSCGVTKVPENLVNAANPGHIADHPDDNHSVANAQYPTPWLYDSKSPIGVLSSGFGEGLNYLLGGFKVATTVVKTDLTILNEPGRSINDLKVLCIGSAGLDGLESSPTFRKKLADFVGQGGVLIDLTTKNGYEFAALPGGEVTGYGWDEDQSCLNNAVSMVRYHQMLSGQTTTNLSVNVDGYLAKWPESATVILQRNKNGMPALITYPYGKGTVISTTMFEDWAYGQSQSTQSGRTLIRDMVAWARLATTLPEFPVGAEVSVPLTIKNISASGTQKIAFSILDPNRNLIKADTIMRVLPAGDSVDTAYSFGSAPNNLGIWYMNYALLTDANAVVQDEEPGQMFVVSDPAGVAKTPDITFDVNSDAEYYASGSQANFTIAIWNHTDAARAITAWWSFPHNYYWGGRQDIYGIPGTPAPYHISNLKETVEVPAKGSKIIAYSVPVYSYDRLWVQFSDERDSLLGRASRGFFTYSPLCSVHVTMDKNEYAIGDSVELTIDLSNVDFKPFFGNVTIKALNPQNNKVWEDTFSMNLYQTIPIKRKAKFYLPAGSSGGAYTIKAEVLNNGNRAGSYDAHFIVPENLFAIIPIVPKALHEGDNTVLFSVENPSLAKVSAAIFEAAFLDPSGSVLWNGSQTFSIEAGSSATVEFTVPLSSLKFGTYSLTYRTQYNGINSKNAHEDLHSSCRISASTGNPFYRIRERIDLDIGITNIGKFRYGTVGCQVFLPGIDSITSTLSLDPGCNSRVSVVLELPETMTAGAHSGEIILTLPSGNSIGKAFSVTVPSSKIEISLDSIDYAAGDNVPVSIENIGGLDAVAQCSFEVKDLWGVHIIKTERETAFRAGEKATVYLSIPANIVSGNYELIVRAYDRTSSDSSVFIKTVNITGLLATLDATTDKQLYTATEAKTASAEATTSRGKIEDGKLKMAVSSAGHTVKTFKAADWKIPVEGLKAKEVVAGLSYAMALTAEGNIVAWGRNYAGLCNVPAGLTGVKSIACGVLQVVAQKEDGTIVIWGENRYGQCDVPAGLSNVKAISTGQGHVVVLKADSTVAAWGNNSSGQCNIPSGLRGVKAIAAGNYHTVALKADGSVVAWGSNSNGQCNVPTGLTGVRAIATSSNHVLAIKADGTVVGWGYNYYKQCNPPASLTGVKAVAAGSGFSVALKEDGTIVTWGNNYNGQCNVPAGISGFKSISSGDGYTIALKSDGSVVAWGLNSDGQCNELCAIKMIDSKSSHVIALNENGKLMAWGSNENRQCNIPAGLTGIKSIAAGGKSSMVLKDDGTAVAWGDNSSGQCNIPVGLTGIKAIDIGWTHSVAVLEDGSLLAWGDNERGQCNIPAGLTGVQAISAGAQFTVAMKGDGSVAVWGDNYYGQCNAPPGLAGVKTVSAGLGHVLAIKNDNSVTAWGYNSYGQCNIPSGLTGVKAVCAGGESSIALKEDGSLVAWGRNSSGQCTIPTGLSGVIAIASRGDSYSALKEDGSVTSWGSGHDEVFPVVKSQGHSLSLTYDAGSRIDWKSIFWNNASPQDTSISLFVRTADSEPALATAQWSDALRTSGSGIILPGGRWMGMKAVSAIDSMSIIPVLDSVTVHGYALEKIWEDSQTVTVDGSALVTKAIGSITAPGMYLLEENLFTSMGQQAARDEYVFYVGSNQVPLTFSTEKKAYKPGETVTVNGRITNNGGAGVSDLPCDFTINGVNVYHATVTLSAGETQSFTFNCTSPDRSFYLSGAINGGDATHYIQVDSAALAVVIVAPSVAGREPFDVIVKLTNSKKVDASVSVNFNGESVPLVVPAGQTKSISRQIAITQTTVKTVVISGDVAATLQKQIVFGEQAVVRASPQAVYPEGVVVIPYSVQNNGQLDTKADITFSMGGQTVVKQAFVPVGQTVNGELTFNQVAGDYSLAFSSFFGGGSAAYRVVKRDRIAMQLDVNRYSAPNGQNPGDTGLVRASVTVSNEGYNGFDGQLSSSTDFFAKTEDLSLASGESKTITYDMDISSVEPGTYTFTASALQGGGTAQQASRTFDVLGPDIALTAVPTGNNFAPGQLVSLAFGLKNKGMVEGTADISLSLNELADESRTSRLAPGVEKQESFIFQIPDDYPEGDYTAEFTIGDSVTEIPLTISGLRLNVAASFDKPFYRIGETAVLNLDITNESGLTPSVYAKASFIVFEDRQDFTLSPHQVVQLHIPVDENTPACLAYGIYANTGRAVHLNTMYIRIAKGAMALYTDKSAYNAGDTVTVNVVPEETGDLSVATTTGYAATMSLAGPTSFSFALPDEIASGTQSIGYQFNSDTGKCDFDVIGYSLKASEVSLDKESYDPVDLLSAVLKVESNKPVSAVVKGWLRAPSGSFTDFFEVTRGLGAGETDIAVSGAMNASEAGTHKFVYGVYSSGTNLTLLVGSKSFDVKPVAIITAAPAQTAYAETDKVSVAVRTFACNDYSGVIEMLDAGDIVASKPVTLNGVRDDTLEIGPFARGLHRLTARLKDIAGVASEKGFQIAVMDVVAPSAPAGLRLGRDGSVIALAWTVNPESDIAGYNVWRNGEKLTVLPLKSTTFRNEGLVAGVPYAYCVMAVDKAGNQSAPSASVSIRLDNTAPVIALSPSSDVVATSPVTLSWSAADDIDPNPAVSASHASPTTFRRTGVYPVSVSATDNQGNRAERTITITLNVPNGAPTLDAIADRGGREGQSLGFQLSASDPNDDALTFSSENPPEGATLDPATGSFAWTPRYDQAGEYRVTFTVTDNGAPPASASREATIVVSDVNRPPAVAEMRDTTIKEGDTLRLAVRADDPDGDALNVTAENMPDGAQFDPISRTFAWTPDYTHAGVYENIRFIAADDGEPLLSDTAVITIVVDERNRPPVLDPIGDKEVNEGQLLTFVVSASDPDGDGLSYDAGNLPTGAAFDGNTRTFTWRPGYHQAGNHQNIVLTVVDNGQPRMCDQEVITVSVGDVNLPPALTAIGDRIVNEGDTLRFTVSASDPDGDQLTYTAGNLPTGAAFDGTTGEFFWAPEFNRAGIYPHILFSVLDDGQPAAGDQEEMGITVGEVNRPPRLALIGNKSALEGGTLEFTITATDPDDDALNYGAANLPPGATFDAATQNFRWTPEFNQSGNYPDVLFTVTDNANPPASDQEAVTITIGNTNRPPVMAPIGDKTVSEGDTLRFTVTASDPDGDDLAYSAGNLPPGASFDPGAQSFTWQVDFGRAGVYSGVWFETSDNGYPPQTVRQTVAIAVGHVNRAPVLSSVGDRSALTEENLRFIVTAADPDGDTVALSASNLPAGASFDPATGVFAWTPACDQAGAFAGVIFAASDGAFTVTDTITLTVVLGQCGGGGLVDSISASPSSLWPPNHKMVRVTVEPVLSDGRTTSCRIVSVSSNEPEKGNESGDKSPDWSIINNLAVDLRAERFGAGMGRNYTITVECTDDNGDKSTGTVVVRVPHDRGND